MFSLPGVLSSGANVISVEDERHFFNYTNQTHNIYSLHVYVYM